MRSIKKNFVVFLSILVSLVVLNSSLSKITGVNNLGKAWNQIAKVFRGDYYYEIPDVSVESFGYEDDNEGSYQVKKSALWTDEDTAEITFDVDSIKRLTNRASAYDVVLVFDKSTSMKGDKYNAFLTSAQKYIKDILKNYKSNVALIGFENKAEIITDLIRDEETLLNAIQSVELTCAPNVVKPAYCTNYYSALDKVEELLESYVPSESRKLVVLFVTDGTSNGALSLIKPQYEHLKEKYPDMIISGIQYEMGKEIDETLKDATDYQFSATIEDLDNKLIEATYINSLNYYEKFEVVDYINNNYFDVKDSKDILVSMGSVQLEDDNGNQKITWTIEPNTLSTGSHAKMTIKADLKPEYIEDGKTLYPTNERFEVRSQLPEHDEVTLTNDQSPVLRRGHTVYYDANYPEECELSYTNKEDHYIYEIVEVSDYQPEACNGYTFKGWESTFDVTDAGNNRFVMPNEDVYMEGTWKKLELAKSMDGTVWKELTNLLYDAVDSVALPDNMASAYVNSNSGIDFTSKSSSTNGKGVYQMASTSGDQYPISYYRGAVDNNNVLFADLCWKIVRTTETGGVKLIYNGKPKSENGMAVCKNTGHETALSSVPFNSDIATGTSDSLAYARYMYGDVYHIKTGAFANGALFYKNVSYSESTKMYTLQSTGSSGNGGYTCNSTASTCSTVRYYVDETNYIELSNGATIVTAIEAMLKNNNSSVAKVYIDDWFAKTMLPYSYYLEDTKWRNDKEIIGFTGQNDFELTSRIEFTNIQHYLELQEDPNIIGSKESWLTVENKTLNYPVGLINSYELFLAGGASNTPNTTYYLYTGDSYWSMSPGVVDLANKKIYPMAVDTSGSIVESFTSEASIGLRPMISLKHDTQYASGNGTPNNPYYIDTFGEDKTLYGAARKGAVSDRISSAYVKSDDGINFKKPASDTNGKGSYLYAPTANQHYPIYYYRGDVTNNNVLFAGICWKMVRTTTTGGVKLIYNGKAKSSGDVCDNTGDDSQLAPYRYNDDAISPVGVGYKFGNIYERKSAVAPTNVVYGTSVEYDDSSKTYTLTSKTGKPDGTHHYSCNNLSGECSTIRYYYYVPDSKYINSFYIELTGGKKIEDALKEMFTHENDSWMKYYIEDEWYSKTMADYTYYLEDTPWCSNTTVASLNGWNATGGNITDPLFFSSYNTAINGVPSFACTSDNELTVDDNELKYPVGLLTLDEAIFAGSQNVALNGDYLHTYLYTGKAYWTMTPYAFWEQSAMNNTISASGTLSNRVNVSSSFGVRPVISLKEGTEYLSGVGTVKDPYVVDAIELDNTLYGAVARYGVDDNIKSEHVSSNSGISFSSGSSTTNGQGVYRVSTTSKNEYPVYYYRGAVTDNNVLFADFCWKIIRTTDTGGVKLIYNGTPTIEKGKSVCKNTGSASQLASTQRFNDSVDSPSHVGYKYGKAYTYQGVAGASTDTQILVDGALVGKSATYDSSTDTYTLSDTTESLDSTHHYTCNNTSGKCSTLRYYYYDSISGSKLYASYINLTKGKLVNDELYSEMFSNDNDSAIKKYIENTWYAKNMAEYDSLLEDTVWCNDKSVYSYGGWSPSGSLSSMLYFSSRNRTNSSGKPDLTCPTKYALTESNGGVNKKVGLITADEVMYAGAGSSGKNNSNYYLYTGQSYWTMTPYSFNNIYPYVAIVYSDGSLDAETSDNVHSYKGVRPVISVKEGTTYSKGNGSPDSPYVIDTPKISKFLYNKVVDGAVPDDITSANVAGVNGIDFLNNSSATNGQGVYMDADTAIDSHPIYYYRGDVNNNNVLFADLCWKIVRTTDTGGIKLIYNGVPKGTGGAKTCDNVGEDTQVTTMKFNNSDNSPAYVGYMYGSTYEIHEDKAVTALNDQRRFYNSATYDDETNTYTLKSLSGSGINRSHYSCGDGGQTCGTLRYYFYTSTLFGKSYYIELTGGKMVEDAIKEMFANKNNSTIKDFIENDWYKNNMRGYTDYLEDTVWCNDMGFKAASDVVGWNPNGGGLGNPLQFDTYYRRLRGNVTFSCSDDYSITVANGLAKYPVGLITLDEVIYAGGQEQFYNGYYLASGAWYWTMSPSIVDSDVSVYSVYAGGYVYGEGVKYSLGLGVRPVISLKPGAMYNEGDGTASAPFVINAIGTPVEPELDKLYDAVTENAVPDDITSANVANADGIDFKKASSATNGQGVYMIADTSQDAHPIYYYRGAVTNNNVIFADSCWKIVRTTEKGGIKLIYNGSPTIQSNKKVCNNSGKDTQVAEKQFNVSASSPAYAGYKYGTSYGYKYGDATSGSKFGASATYNPGTGTYTLTSQTSVLDANHHYTCNNDTGTCSTLRYYYYTTETASYYIELTSGKLIEDALSELFSSNNDSTIKDYLENNWFANNMTSNIDKLEDAVWCSDRSYERSKEESGWNPNGGALTNLLYFDARYRQDEGAPSLSCRDQDSLTLNNGGVRNAVGLITSDEVIYAGGTNSSNNSYYLYTGSSYWVMSPYSFDNYNAHAFAINPLGYLAHDYVYNSYGVRPVIALKADTTYSRGTGLMDDPYIIAN